MNTDECEVQLHLHNADGYPVHLYGRGTDMQELYTIRVQCGQQKGISNVNHMFQTNGDGKVTLKFLDGYSCLQECGESSSQTFTANNFLMFTTRTKQFQGLVLCISVHENAAKNPDPPLLGRGYVAAAQLGRSIGKLIITLVNNVALPVGHIQVDYLVVKPWKRPVNCDDSTPQVAVKNGCGAALCGHRGAGASFDTEHPSSYPENTIAAFKAAPPLGLQFVEFDVHVTRDHIPVVFHDDTVKLCAETNQPAGTTMSIGYEVPVKDLTLKQSRQVKVWKRSQAVADPIAVGERRHHSDINPKIHDKSLFPTLEEVFIEVPQDVGFLIEVKYPMETLSSGRVEHLCSDANILVDAILKVIFENAHSRKIFIICFDPNICAMLKLKQSKFPVLFLSTCENDEWKAYKDMRTRTLADAVAFTRSHDLDGLSLYSTPLIKSPHEIERIRGEGLVLSTWGEENNDASKRQWQEDRGVQYITVDRI